MIKVDKLKEVVALVLLKKIIDKLDELDEEDYFGSEGWQHYFGMEDF